jgi:hypothetical protein
MTITRLLFGSFLIVSLALGCAPNSQAPAKLSGSVSYKGQPIKAGTMRFHTAEGVGYDAQISPDGTYTATDIPEGDLVITVETESINPNRKGGTGKDAEKRANTTQPPPAGMSGPADPSVYYIKVPAKYANPKTSPLSVPVKAGRQVHNVELTD